MEMVYVLLAAVVVLQIITITIVRGNKKHRRNNYEFKHSRSDGRNDRKEGDFRRGGNNNNNRKNQHESKGGRPQHSSSAPAQQSSQVTIDPVEKSLRDINLKLKNAEREQESARKKINDYGAKDGRPQRPERSGGGNGGAGRKNNRDRNFNRGEQRKENWNHEKQNRADSAEQPAEAAAGVPAPEFENEKLHAAMQPAVETAVSVTESVSIDTPASSEGDFEHGRKFVAKRRHLQENGAAETDASAAGESASEAPAAEQVSEETTAEMKFGRR